MVLYRQMSNINWEDRTNQSGLEELSLERWFLNHIRGIRLKYDGHAVGNPRLDMMSTVLKVKVDVQRNRAAMTYFDNIRKDSGLSQNVRRCDDRDDCRRVVANAGAANFEHGDDDR